MARNPLTVVMYHYVRPVADSAYPRIRGLELAGFEGQLDYIERHYNPVSMEDVIAAAHGRALPEAPLLLTFDDGYLDHYRHVFPVLKRRGLTGVFFPPVCAVRDREMLDVNKIHFILASIDKPGDIIAQMEEAVRSAGERPVSHYRELLHKPSRFDDADTAYVKRMLQFELPETLRSEIISTLFARCVSADAEGFADGFYMTEAHLREMLDGGMSVGGHGYAHRWLDKLPVADQADDIKRTHDWLQSLAACDRHFIFCYPYGGYTEDTVRLLREHDCAAAFTTRVALADIAPGSMLELPRIDTNDLPKAGDAPACLWTSQAAAGA